MQHRYRVMGRGDPVPPFTASIGGNPRYPFDTSAGRYVLLGLFGVLSDAQAKTSLALVREHRALFDDERLAFFGVTSTPADEKAGLTQTELPGIRYVLDYDGAVGRLLGSVPADAPAGLQTLPYRRQWLLLDPMQRVVAALPMEAQAAERERFAAMLSALPPLERFAGYELHPPVLVLPNIFEPELCEQLIRTYEEGGGKDSGFMREVDGKTVSVFDHRYKRRADHNITDAELVKLLQAKVHRRVLPEVQKAYQFKATRMERYIVGCYEAETSGHFNAHRDNTTKGTAHRRFALSVNLNSEFEGGELSFPEFGTRSFKPPPGTGVVFSCSLLHAVSAVTKGRRYAFLPFLYDEEAARMREENNKFLAEGLGEYRP